MQSLRGKEFPMIEDAKKGVFLILTGRWRKILEEDGWYPYLYWRCDEDKITYNLFDAYRYETLKRNGWENE